MDIEMKSYASLKGIYRHFCEDWDGLAIDENSPEWDCCTCLKTSILRKRRILDLMVDVDLLKMRVAELEDKLTRDGRHC